MKIIKLATIIIMCNIFLAACNGDGGSNNTPSSKLSDTPSTPSGNVTWDNIPSGTNQVPLTLSHGINGKAVNRPFINLTVCPVNDTKHCQTINNVLVDSGSSGLRINKSALKAINFAPIMDNNKSVFNCILFGAGYDIGKMYSVDLYIGGEKGSNIPLQVTDNSDKNSQIAKVCSNYDTIPAANLDDFGASAIIGISVIDSPDKSYSRAEVCDDSGNNCSGIYSSGLNINPLSKFATDNNGVIFSIPKVATALASDVVGTLTFGLNTQSDNTVENGANVQIVHGTASDSWGSFSADNGVNAIFDSGSATINIAKNKHTDIQICTVNVIRPINIFCPANQTAVSIGYGDISSLENQYTLNLMFIDPRTFADNIYIVPDFATSSDDPSQEIFGIPAFFGRNIYLQFASANTNTPFGASPAWGVEDNNN